MTMPANPVAQWTEPSDGAAAVSLTGYYWHFDAPTLTWTLVTDPRLESGRFVDVSGTGQFTLLPLGSISGAPAALVASRRPDGTTFIY